MSRASTRGMSVAVALGSNLEPRREHLQRALAWLEGLLGDMVRSGVYESEPREDVGGPPFLNMCVSGRTRLPPRDLLEALLAREREQGRVRSPTGGRARTLDLDLLFYGDRVIQGDELRVPHPRMTERAFVLLPLAEVAGAWCHPEVDRSVRDLAAGVDASGLRRLGEAAEVLTG